LGSVGQGTPARGRGNDGMTNGENAKQRLQALLGDLERTLGELESTDDATDAVDRLTAMAELAREVQAEVDRLRREGDAADASA
jgi:hypothetical protein